MNTKIGILLTLLCLILSLSSPAQGVLAEYIQEGIDNNLVLKEKNISIEHSNLALKDAKSYFLPAVDFGMTYNLAKGGRTIDFPVGDLLNDVYSTLNALTQSSQFHQLENVKVNFLANNFYDARFRVSMPLINPHLSYQKDIREKQVQVSEYDLAIYKATLIQDIKLAYFDFCTAHTAIEVIKSSKKLVDQNLKDNQSLLENGKGLPASVLRAESEVENINALMIEAENRKKNASYYLNFLLNRPLETELIFEEQYPDWEKINSMALEDNLSYRPELLRIATFHSIQETQLKSSKNYWIPRLNTFADLGSQAFNFDVSNQDSPYVFFGLNLSMPIFQGSRNRYQIQRSQLDMENISIQERLIENKLSIDLKVAKNQLRTSEASFHTAEKKEDSSDAYLRLVSRGFKEGAYSLIEFIDARNQYTQAALQKTINAYALLKAQATLERQLLTDSY
ncbi:outer membrane protein TolC [Algoriphagus sp. 4150]|uniref:TolC family protein n=1 Tax=Algoriphagus sp. 4150 TaxID=2817756 RepID=UPI0028674061|nr:TolC family protein [Algoriphagus sp. 4150]MDR7131947.1 outer membrane protein TolC [Algoriphagus sp. 4150]